MAENKADMSGADAIENADQVHVEPTIVIKDGGFSVGDVGPFDVSERTLSEIEKDIADLEVAKKLIRD